MATKVPEFDSGMNRFSPETAEDSQRSRSSSYRSANLPGVRCEAPLAHVVERSLGRKNTEPCNSLKIFSLEQYILLLIIDHCFKNCTIALHFQNRAGQQVLESFDSSNGGMVSGRFEGRTADTIRSSCGKNTSASEYRGLSR